MLLFEETEKPEEKKVPVSFRIETKVSSDQEITKKTCSKETLTHKKASTLRHIRTV
jgi:hypothetical protein